MVLNKRFGQVEAIEIMRSVSRDHGLEVGRTFSHFALNDFEGLLQNFFMGPDNGATFSPAVERLDETGLHVHMKRCALKTAWHEAGCSDEEVCTLLYCASAYDEAVMEAAGFNLDLELWSPGKEGCCLSKVTVKG